MNTITCFDQVAATNVQQFWNARPCNIRHSPKKVGTVEYFNEVESRKYFVEPHIPSFADFPRWKDKRVLEIGCGIGTDTINFARHGATVTAVDLSDRSLEVAQQRAEVFGLQDRIHFHHVDCEELDETLDRQPYDLVYSFGVIHHTPHPWQALKQIRKFMGVDSELRLMVYSRISYKLFWMMRLDNVWNMDGIDELIARNSEAQTGCPVTYTYTHRELMKLLEDFDVLDARKAHIFTWDIESYARHEYKRDTAWSNVNEDQLRDLEEELGWHWMVRARLQVEKERLV